MNDVLATRPSYAECIRWLKKITGDPSLCKSRLKPGSYAVTAYQDGQNGYYMVMRHDVAVAEGLDVSGVTVSIDKIEDLEQRWRQASDVAFASIGQSDRAENVAYRDELAEKLRRARAEANLFARR